MIHLLLVAALLQPMGPPAECPERRSVDVVAGQTVPCTGILISEAASDRARELRAERDVLQVRLDAAGERIDLVTAARARADARLDKALDVGLQLHAATEAPPPVTWWDRPGWPTVIVGGVLAFAAGGVTAWAVLR